MELILQCSDHVITAGASSTPLGGVQSANNLYYNKVTGGAVWTSRHTPILHEAAIRLHCIDTLTAMQLIVENIAYVLVCCCSCAWYHDVSISVLTKCVP